jgi:DNA-binding response OmpR family regulator
VTEVVVGRGSGKPVVLLVDADAGGRLPVEVSLKAAGFDVLVAGSELEALAALGRQSADLMVADADLLAAFSPQLSRRLKADPKRVPVLLVATRGTLEDRTRALDLAVDDLLVRPVWSRELAARVRLLLQRELQAELVSLEPPLRASITGNLADVAAPDILRSVELNRRSGTIRLRGPQGSGIVYFRDGRAVDADMGALTGRDAIYRLLAFEEGDFTVSWGHVDRPDVVGTPPRALVLDGVRRLTSPAPLPHVTLAREPGVDRIGTVVSGTIQDNRGTGSTSVGWAPALVPPGGQPGLRPAVRRRNLKLAAIGAAVGSLLVLLFVLLPGRGRPVPASEADIVDRPRRPTVTPVTRPRATEQPPGAADPGTDPFGRLAPGPSTRPSRADLAGARLVADTAHPDPLPDTRANAAGSAAGAGTSSDRLSGTAARPGGDQPAVRPERSAAAARVDRASRSEDEPGQEPAINPVQACRDVSSLGRAARTVEVCTRAFFVLPDSAVIASIVAHAELDQGHYDLAGDWARKAVEIDPELAEPYAFLGFVADQAGRDREARTAYRRYLELAPRGPYAEDINAILRED